MGRKLKTIYELFSDYEKEKINEVIATLSNEEKELIRKEIEELTNNQKERHSFLENLKETKDDFKDKISTFWIHTVNGVQANIAKAQLTIREAQENIKNWFEQRDKSDYIKAAAVIGIVSLIGVGTAIYENKTENKTKQTVITPYGYTMECDDGRIVTGRSEMEANAMCAYKDETKEKAPIRTTLTKPTGYAQKEVSEEVEPEKISEVSIKMDNYAEQDKQINVLEEKEIIKIDELDNDKKLEKVEENIKNGEIVMEIKNNTIDNAYQVEQKVEDIKNDLIKEETKKEVTSEEEIKDAPEITVTENNENDTIDYSTTVTEKTDTGKEKTVTITMSAENTTFEQASEKLDEYKKELEKEQEKLKVNISEQDRIEHEFRY